MITAEQKAHFETFGFLFLRQALSQDEINDVIREAEEVMKTERGGRPRAQEEEQSVAPFVELSPKLSPLAEDDRIYGTVEQLFGPDLIWAGSEANVTVDSVTDWHADRHGESQLGYDRVKVMLYLDTVTADHGALRVIPGSHRMPLYMDLDVQMVELRQDPQAQPFGVEGSDLPGFPLESNPGDVVFFNHNLYHAVYNGWAGRRYIALKYAENPRSPEDVDKLTELASGVFNVHDSFLNSQSPRIRGMVDRLMAAAPKGRSRAPRCSVNER